MHWIKVKTKYNTVEMIVDDYFSEEVQEIINQPYVEEVYLRWITEKECERNPEYSKVKRLERKNNNVPNRI